VDSATQNVVAEKGNGVVYTCPMHPEIQQDKPGMCSECGMQLVSSRSKKKRGDHGEHDKHAGHSTKMFFRKFWVSLVLTIPVVLYADVVETIFSWSPPAFPGSDYLPLILGSIVFFYGGSVFLAGAWREIMGRLPGMMTLIALAISAAYFWSVYAIIAHTEALFWELTTLITIMLLGHWLEMRAVSGAQGALKELSKLLPDTAEVIRNGVIITVPLSLLHEGDVVLVKPGTKIPADGTIIDGDSEVNESMVTGESKPVSKKEKDAVIAGTINGDGALTVRVAHIGEHTFLAGVMRLVAEAQASKSRLQILSDRAALYLTALAVGGGVITLIAWLLVGAEVGFAVARLVAVLVIACPHALGLAVPLVASISTTKAAQSGFLVKQRLALEAARDVDVILFDKTGTLTEANFIVTAASSSEALSLAAAVNVHSEHPIGKAIVADAKNKGLTLSEVKDFKRIPGRGAEATISSHRIFVGTRGGDDIVVEKDGYIVGQIVVADMIRPESKEAVTKLKNIGAKVAMITGDSHEVSAAVASTLGLDEYFARVLPHQKSEKVKELQNRGLRVAMVGDGVNDAPALTQADLGIAIGAGTNVAIESAGIILMRNDPRDIVKIITLSRMTYTKMIQNLFWATGYNIVALPLAAGVLYSKGIILDPAIAAVFMSFSTVVVAINALLLKRKTL
jgi:Cu2+-exporting ATPase